MNPPNFYGSKVEEDSQEFIGEIYKILYAIRLSTSEKAELDTYQLKDVAQNWYVQWKDNRPLRGGPVTWEVFKKVLLIGSFLGRRGNPRWWISSTFVKEV